MLAPLCDPGGTTSRWAALTWTIFGWLTDSALILPPIITLIILPWLVLPLQRVRRQLSGLGVALLFVYLFLGSPLAIALGSRMLVTPLPNDSGQTADAIVVLGRGTDLREQRVEVAAGLWQSHRAPLIFASGRGDATQIADSLKAQGIPEQAIDGEPCSRTTEENARFTATLLQPRGVKRILLVTDPPHMLRSFLTFRSLGFEVTPHANPLPTRLAPRRTAFLIFREYMGLVSYGFLGRFSPRTVPPDTSIASGLTAPHQVQ